MRSRLAVGATSEVFVGHDERLDRPVAIKVLHGDTLDPRRFRSEARLLANLDHPGLVRLYDAVDADHAAVLIMELIDGPSLASVAASGPLGEERVRLLGRELATCLAYLHAQGVVHRDVKPGNILIGADGQARLADFGIARLVDATRLTATGQAIGTLRYMAPEQVTGGAVGPPADVYALGLVLLEAVSGQPAFRGEASEVLAARLVRGPDIPADLAPGWQRLLADMTAVAPDARPSASVVAGRLAPGRRGATGVLAASPTAPVGHVRARGRRHARVRRAALSAAIAAVVVLIALVVLVWPGGGSPSTAHPPTTLQTNTAPVKSTTAPSTVPLRGGAPSTAVPLTTVPTTAAPPTASTTTLTTIPAGGGTPTTVLPTTAAPTTTTLAP